MRNTRGMTKNTLMPVLLIGAFLAALAGCAAKTGPTGPVYAQRAYLGQIGMPTQSDVAIIMAPQEHVIWVSMADSAAPAPYQWLAPQVPIKDLVQEAISMASMRAQQPTPPDGGKAIEAPTAAGLIQEATVHFPFGAWRLAESDKVQLNALKVAPAGTVTVFGHTDSVGSDAYNLTLSAQRANSVKNHLVVRGVPKENVTTQASGKAGAVASNDTEEGRAKNRRADVVVKEGEK